MISLLLLLSPALALAARSCYSRNGTLIDSPAYQACNNDTSHDSVCCGINHSGAGDTGVADDTCETNGLCQNWAGDDGTGDPPMLWWRQGCTDPTWASPYCLKDVCNFGLWQNDNAPVQKCGDNQWCCGDANCCSITTSVFALAATVGPTSASTSASASLPTSAPATTTPPTSTPTSTSPPAPANNILTTGAKVGAGLGVGLGVIMLGIIVVLGLKLRRKRKTADIPPQNGGAGEKQSATVYGYHPVSPPPAELHGQALAAEIGAERQRAELDGDRDGAGRR